MPIGAGTYDVNVSRPADGTYAKFDATYVAVLTIDKATRTIDNFTAEAIDKGYNYLELEVGGIDDLHEDAVASYTLKELAGGLIIDNYKQSTSTSAYVSGLSPDTEYVAMVSITGDPNYHDATSTSFKEAGTTAPAPTEKWIDSAQEPPLSGDTYSISTVEQLAWIAQQTNGGKNDFSGKTVALANDLGLYGRIWTPIGNGSYPFKGTFDGNDCTISGMYVSGGNYQGLFGSVSGANTGTSDTTIKNVTLVNSYVKGDTYVGGIVGYLLYDTALSSCVVDATVEGTEFVGGVAGYNWYLSTIHSCVSYGKVYSSGDNAGGIAGSNLDASDILSCVNFATVWGGGNHTGGILGYNAGGKIINNANLGTVKGISAVGGVLGENADSSCVVYNNYNAGSVKGNGEYVAAVCGRNVDNDGKVNQGYWMHGMAYDGTRHCQGMGTKDGDTDNVTNGQTTYFNTFDGSLSRDLGYGTTDLITALNAYASAKEYEAWVAVEALGGAPIPVSVERLL